MSEGLVFNIQKYSVHDGPGIRTTVFLKGCPLECQWCHNPESIGFKSQIVFWKDRCIGCGRCKVKFPEQKIEIVNKKASFTKGVANLPIEVSEICPTQALELAGIKMSSKEVIDEVRKDTVFYDQSNGGVTFSGGEPLAQLDFLKELLIKAKTFGLHTTVDTTGYSKWENIEEILPYVDLFLLDVKHMDSEKHKEFTGVSNELILENIKKISDAGKRIFARMPVIPTVNDDDNNLTKMGEFLSSIQIEQINILPYHDIAKNKYKQLGKIYKLKDLEVPSDEQMSCVEEKLKSYGLKVIIGG